MKPLALEDGYWVGLNCIRLPTSAAKGQQPTHLYGNSASRTLRTSAILCQHSALVSLATPQKLGGEVGESCVVLQGEPTHLSLQRCRPPPLDAKASATTWRQCRKHAKVAAATATTTTTNTFRLLRPKFSLTTSAACRGVTPARSVSQ